MINYERFCQDIDVVFNLPVIFFVIIQDKEKDPTVRIPNFDYSITHSKK